MLEPLNFILVLKQLTTCKEEIKGLDKKLVSYGRVSVQFFWLLSNKLHFNRCLHTLLYNFSNVRIVSLKDNMSV